MLSTPKLPPHRSGNMDHNGARDKMTALLRFDPCREDAWQALQRWTGVHTCYLDHLEWRLPGPARARYCRGDPERDARITMDVASIPPMPPPAPGPGSAKHGRHSNKAIRNSRLSRSVQMPRGSAKPAPNSSGEACPCACYTGRATDSNRP